MHTLILPWVIFLLLFVIIEVFHAITIDQILHGSLRQTLAVAYTLGVSFIFHSAYWFIPMSIISALALIILKKMVNNVWFGVLLALVTFFYCVNLYGGWVAVNHTKAVLGYTFFMWLGVQLKVNLPKIKSAIDNMFWPVLLPTLLLGFVIACNEGRSLMHLGSADAYASIRLSNVFVSIIIFISLLKSDSLAWVNNLNPRKYVFGLYLVHCIIISQLAPIVKLFMPAAYLHTHIVNSVLIQFLFFGFILAISYLVVTVIKRSRLSFIIGIAH